MDFNRTWTSFALDAEVDSYGTGRIAIAHNEHVSRLAKNIADMAPRTCLWNLDAFDSYYETSCGNAFDITSGTPSKNGMKFCCYCGGVLEDVSSSTTEDEVDDE